MFHCKCRRKDQCTFYMCSELTALCLCPNYAVTDPSGEIGMIAVCASCFELLDNSYLDMLHWSATHIARYMGCL